MIYKKTKLYQEHLNLKGMSMTKTVIAVVISTSLGDITLELDKEKAPGTVENFIKRLFDHFSYMIKKNSCKHL